MKFPWKFHIIEGQRFLFNRPLNVKKEEDLHDICLWPTIFEVSEVEEMCFERQF
jgi:hypothetical protein